MHIEIIDRIVSVEYMLKRTFVAKLQERGIPAMEAGAYDAFREIILYGVTIDTMLQKKSEYSQAIEKAWDLAKKKEIPWCVFNQELEAYVDKVGHLSFVKSPEKFVDELMKRIEKGKIQVRRYYPLSELDPIYCPYSPAVLRGAFFWDAPGIPREELGEREKQIFEEYSKAYVRLPQVLSEEERKSLRKEILDPIKENLARMPECLLAAYMNPQELKRHYERLIIELGLAEEAIRNYFKTHKEELLKRITKNLYSRNRQR